MQGPEVTLVPRVSKVFRASAVTLARKEIRGVKVQKEMSARRALQAQLALQGLRDRKEKSGFRDPEVFRGQLVQLVRPALWDRKA